MRTPLVTPDLLRRVMPSRLPVTLAAEYAPLLDSALQEFGICTPLRVAAYLAQVAHESAELTRMEENLSYSAEALLRVWPKRFTAAEAQRYARRPQAIANRAYANRYGNGPESSGDGWLFRGRGPGQVTFRDNYGQAGQLVGLDLVKDPDLAAVPEHAFRIFAAYWKRRRINGPADLGQIDDVTRLINPAMLGKEERRTYYKRALQAFGLKEAAA